MSLLLKLCVVCICLLGNLTNLVSNLNRGIIMCCAGGFILCRNWDNFLKLMMLMFTCSLVSILLGLLHLSCSDLNLANALWLCSVKQEASFMTVAEESVNYVVIFYSEYRPMIPPN